MKNQLNPYQVTWATIIPEFGKITKRDAKIFSKVFGFANYPFESNVIDIHAPTREIMIQKLSEVAEIGLFKSHTAYLYTDKQFGQRKGNSFQEVLTTKQSNNPIELISK